MSWDNRTLNINGETSHLPLALRFAFEQSDHKKAVGWCVRGNSLLILPYKQDQPGETMFPSTLTYESIVPSINGWLMEEWLSPRAPEKPDHDGSNLKGWRMFCDDWGMVKGMRVVFAITPEWLWLGK